MSNTTLDLELAVANIIIEKNDLKNRCEILEIQLKSANEILEMYKKHLKIGKYNNNITEANDDK
jgi:hypothetical protein